MSPKEFRQQALAACDAYQLTRRQFGKHDAELHFAGGLRVHIHFPHRREFTHTIALPFVHFALRDIGEEIARRLSLETGHCWWKWNILICGHPVEVRKQMLAALQRRLARCVECGVIQPIFPAAAASGESPDALHNTRSGGDSL